MSCPFIFLMNLTSIIIFLNKLVVCGRGWGGGVGGGLMFNLKGTCNPQGQVHWWRQWL